MSVLDSLRQQLIQNAEEANRIGGQRFFKEKIVLYGVKTKLVEDLAKSYFRKIDMLPKEEIFALCDELWKSGYIEETFIVARWTYLLRKKSEPSDFAIYESWISKYINNWASCDSFCNHTVGEFVIKYPEFMKDLKRWAKSDNLWMRRAAAVSLIIPAREGKFLKDIFEIALILLKDKEDLVQKGYGWMLKAASKPYQQEVFEFIMKNKAAMPRTALRYAIEKMPADLKLQAMAKG
jgi:3-methyladenine DNA glycosylase AlkD